MTNAVTAMINAVPKSGSITTSPLIKPTTSSDGKHTAGNSFTRSSLRESIQAMNSTTVSLATSDG